MENLLAKHGLEKEKSIARYTDHIKMLEALTIYPVHPRNRERAQRICKQYGFKNIILIQPVQYSTSVYLTQHAKKIVTGSGGLQREAFFAGKQCVTVLDFIVWPETMIGNRNQLAFHSKAEILKKLRAVQEIDPTYQPFGDGHAAEKIVELLLK